jgi:hypothetical protein
MVASHSTQLPIPSGDEYRQQITPPKSIRLDSLVKTTFISIFLAVLLFRFLFSFLVSNAIKLFLQDNWVAILIVGLVLTVIKEYLISVGLKNKFSFILIKMELF